MRESIPRRRQIEKDGVRFGRDQGWPFCLQEEPVPTDVAVRDGDERRKAVLGHLGRNLLVSLEMKFIGEDMSS